MSFLSGEARRRARRELQEALESITYRLDHLESAPEPAYDLDRLQAIMAGVSGKANSRLDDLETRLGTIEAPHSQLVERLKNLTFAVAEGIERVARSERRIDATIKRARKELADHGLESQGLEAEAAELQLVDGKRSEEHGVYTVSTDVAPSEDTPSSIKGVPAATLRRVRGF